MITPSDLATVYADLHQVIMPDASALLAALGCWLDPANLEFPEHDDYTWEHDIDLHDGDGLWCCWHRARGEWPWLYAEINYMAHEGMSETEIEERTLELVNARIVPGGAMMELSEFYYDAVPLEFLGIDPYDDDFWRSCRADFVAEVMGFKSHRHADIYRGLARDILGNSVKDTMPHMETMFSWIFSDSGNGTFDYAYGQYEGEYPNWSELDFVFEVYVEAEELYEQALKAVIELEDDDEMFASFCSNFLIAYVAGIQEAHHDHRNIQPEFYWASDADRRSTGETIPFDQLHAVWHRFAA